MDSPFVVMTSLTGSYITDICWDMYGKLMLYSTYDGHLMFSYFKDLPSIILTEGMAEYASKIYGSLTANYIQINDHYCKERAIEFAEGFNGIKQTNDDPNNTQSEIVTFTNGEKKKVIKPQLIQKYHPYTNVYPQNPYSVSKEFRKIPITVNYPVAEPYIHSEQSISKEEVKEFKESKEIKEEKKPKKKEKDKLSKEKEKDKEKDKDKEKEKEKVKEKEKEEHIHAVEPIKIEEPHIKCDGTHNLQIVMGNELQVITFTVIFKNGISVLEWKDSQNKIICTYRISKEKVVFAKANAKHISLYTTDSMLMIFGTDGQQIAMYKVMPVQLLNLSDTSMLILLSIDGFIKLFDLVSNKLALRVKVAHLCKSDQKITDAYILNNELHVCINECIIYKYDKNFEEFKKIYDSQIILQSYDDKVTNLLSKLYHTTISISSSLLEERSKFPESELDIIDYQFVYEKLKLLEEHNMIAEYKMLIGEYTIKVIKSNNLCLIQQLCNQLLKDGCSSFKLETLKQNVLPLMNLSKSEEMRSLIDVITNAINDMH